MTSLAVGQRETVPMLARACGQILECGPNLGRGAS